MSGNNAVRKGCCYVFISKAISAHLPETRQIKGIGKTCQVEVYGLKGDRNKM